MRYIVTLTSYGHRVESTAPYAICSLLNQTVLPDRIILWLAYDTPVPLILIKLCEIGLEIKFCRDLKSYKKLIPALVEFPDDVLVTADDDHFYPNNWFEQLKTAFLKDTSKIYVHRVHSMTFDNEQDLAPYRKWDFCVLSVLDERLIFPTGGGGILYPPNSLHAFCSNVDTFLAVAPTADDIWFWAMARLKGTKYAIIKDGYRFLRNIDPFNEGLWKINIKGENDRQMRNVINQYPALKILLSEAKRQLKPIK